MNTTASTVSTGRRPHQSDGRPTSKAPNSVPIRALDTVKPRRLSAEGIQLLQRLRRAGDHRRVESEQKRSQGRGDGAGQQHGAAAGFRLSDLSDCSCMLLRPPFRWIGDDETDGANAVRFTVNAPFSTDSGVPAGSPRRFTGWTSLTSSPAGRRTWHGAGIARVLPQPQHGAGAVRIAAEGRDEHAFAREFQALAAWPAAFRRGRPLAAAWSG